MADLAAGDVTCTQVGKSEIGKFSRVNVIDIAFGDGAKTYPSGGIPIAATKLGLKDHVDSVHFVGGLNGFHYEFDITNSKLRIFTQGATVGAAGAQTMDDFPVTAGPGVTSDTHLSLKSGSKTVRIGPLKEVEAGVDAPAATTLRATVKGW